MEQQPFSIHDRRNGVDVQLGIVGRLNNRQIQVITEDVAGHPGFRMVRKDHIAGEIGDFKIILPEGGRNTVVQNVLSGNEHAAALIEVFLNGGLFRRG